jgi:hypothetical protein
MKSQKIPLPIILVLLLSLTAGVVELAESNPLPSPLINVDSPKNNQIYPTNTIQLAFTKDLYAYYNFSGYSIDGPPEKATDGNTVMANLAAGSHNLTIYGNTTYLNDSSNSSFNNMMLAKVYFSTVYSTAWVTFALILVVSISVVSLVLFTNRRKLARRFKAEKTDIFWVGLPCFFLASGLFILSVWLMASGYLYPYYYSRFGFDWTFPILGSTIGLISMGLGVFMLDLGTRERQGVAGKQASAAPQKS